ncbi:MAG: secretin N-terminal domain-containing protein [Candidatus Omnitrophota bacterium]|jgi:type IV pilus assembly protein PilQ
MKNKIRLLFFLMLLCVFMPCGTVLAQDAEKQIIEYLEFREVDIKDVLRQLAKQYNLNIVFSELVKGLVTVQLNNVSVEQAMDSVITVNGFAYNKKENVYKVATQEEAGREGKQTKLFKLNNADAVALKDTLAKVLSADGSCEADSRSNSLLVTDSVMVINKIGAMIPELDELTPQVLIEAKFIETALTNTEKLGIDWSTTMSVSGAKRPITWPFSSGGDASLNKIVPEGNPTDAIGFPNPKGFPYTNSDKLVEDSTFKFGTIDFSELKAVFDFLAVRDRTKLVANPRVVTTNNQEATINVGKKLSLPLYKINDTTGAYEVNGWTEKDVGVKLVVTPQVSHDGYIKLKLKPEVNSLVGYASTRNGVNEGPITSTRNVTTEVQILDGQTVVIGGLVKEETLNHIKKIPVLGDIPVLGYLFKRKEVGSDGSPAEKTDLLIFVTARIIKDNRALIAKAEKSEAFSASKFKLKLRDIKNYRVE